MDEYNMTFYGHLLNVKQKNPVIIMAVLTSGLNNFLAALINEKIVFITKYNPRAVDYFCDTMRDVADNSDMEFVFIPNEPPTNITMVFPAGYVKERLDEFEAYD